MEYRPKSYESLNFEKGTYSPNTIKPFNNEAFIFWQRSLFQRAASQIGIDGWPRVWDGLGVKDFFYYILLRQGYLAITEDDKNGLGKYFAFCSLGSELNKFYQPTRALLITPENRQTQNLEIGVDCEVVKLTPDYMGIWDIISYFAEKLALNDTSVNTSLINSKLAYLFGAKTKAAAEAIKLILDRVNKGEPATVYDKRIQDDPVSKTEPFQMLKLFSATDFITDKLLETHQTIIDEFDAEIGIKTTPYKKKERMVTAEADSKTEDSAARVNLWIRCLNDSFKRVNEHYGMQLRAYQDKEETNGEDNSDRLREVAES